jgi:hypothetical protein
LHIDELLDFIVLFVANTSPVASIVNYITVVLNIGPRLAAAGWCHWNALSAVCEVIVHVVDAVWTGGYFPAIFRLKIGRVGGCK